MSWLDGSFHNFQLMQLHIVKTVVVPRCIYRANYYSFRQIFVIEIGHKTIRCIAMIAGSANCVT